MHGLKAALLQNSALGCQFKDFVAGREIAGAGRGAGCTIFGAGRALATEAGVTTRGAIAGVAGALAAGRDEAGATEIGRAHV